MGCCEGLNTCGCGIDLSLLCDVRVAEEEGRVWGILSTIW